MDLTSHQEIHQSVQYLAAAAKSFLPEQSTDFHTSLIWDADKTSFVSHEISEEGARLALNLEYYSLDVLHPEMGEIASYPIGGANHLDILNWIGREKYLLGIERDYSFEMHFELPYPKLHDRSTHTRVNKTDLQQHIALRNLANDVLHELNPVFDKMDKVLVWPHHFDSAVIGYFDDMPQLDSIGLGLAMPDSISDSPYFYAAAYKGNNAIDVKKLADLKSGKWENGDFKGAILVAENVDIQKGVAFCKEAINAFLNG